MSLADHLPDDLKASPALKDFKDVAGLAKSFIDYQRMANERVPVPGDDAPQEDVDRFYKRIGRPEKPDDYAVTVPDGHQVTDEQIKRFRETAHGVGLTKRQAQALLRRQLENIAADRQASDQKHREAADRTTAALRAEWGEHYEKRQGAAAAAIEKLVPTEALEEARRLAQRAPGLYRALARVGEMLTEDSSAFAEGRYGSGGGGDFDARIKQLKDDPKGPYWNRSHPDHKAAVKELEGLLQQKAQRR